MAIELDAARKQLSREGSASEIGFEANYIEANYLTLL